jgi:hypothetical protein
MAELTAKDDQRCLASSWVIGVGIPTPSEFEDGLPWLVMLTLGLWTVFVIGKVLLQFLAIHFVHINFIQGSNHKWLLVVLYRPESYRAIHVANSEEMASRMYRNRRNIRPSMFEKVLSIDSSAFLGDEERKEKLRGRHSPSLLGPLQV